MAPQKSPMGITSRITFLLPENDVERDKGHPGSKHASPMPVFVEFP